MAAEACRRVTVHLATLAIQIGNTSSTVCRTIQTITAAFGAVQWIAERWRVKSSTFALKLALCGHYLRGR